MMKIKRFFLQIILALFFSSGTLGAFEITANTQIVISSKAEASTQLAAREIAGYIWKSSGIKPDIVPDRSRSSSKIFIGTLADVKNLPRTTAEKLAAARSPDAFAIVCCGNTLIIAGKDRPGELYGVYAFLQEKMNIRWFRAATADDPFEYVPKVSHWKFDDVETVRDPAFRYRLLTHSSATGKTPVNGQTAAVRQGFQINPPWNYKRAFQEKFYQERCSQLTPSAGGHGAFYTPVPTKLYDKHPEYFALQDGKRIRGEQICISNPQVQKLVQQYIEDIYKTVPVKNISWLFGMTDATTGWCECAGCRKLDDDENFDYINVSNRFHKVAVRIMAEIYKKYPTARLEAWAYHTYRNIPQGVKYDPRALIYYCTHGRCYGHGLSDPACRRNVAQLDLIKEWRKISSRMKVYEYANCTPVFYGCMENILTEDLRLYRQLGLEGWKEEMLFADAQFWPRAKKGEVDHRADRANSNWQWYCVAGRLLWDPDLDPAEILADVESKYYGKAYPAMKKYHDLRRQLWNNSPHCLGYPTGDQRRERLLSVPGTKEKLLGLLAEAEKLAQNDAILKKRLQDDRQWLFRYWIKPNEAFRKKTHKTGTIPFKVGAVNIDGDPADAEWFRAWHTTDFKLFPPGGKNTPHADQTTLSVLADERNLYFRVIAKGKEGLKSEWNKEHIAFYIIPPGAAGECYNVSVNANGSIRRSIKSEKCRSIPGKVSAAVKSTPSAYTMEIKIPLTGIGAAEKGALWKLNVVRKTAAGSWGLDGTMPQDRSNYRDCVIAEPLLRNGNIEVLTAKGTPEYWSMNSNCSIIKHRTGHAVKLPSGGWIYQLLASGELAQSPTERKIKITFRAAGKGVMKVYAMRYNDTRNGKAKHRYTRKFFSTPEIYQTELTGKQQSYSCQYTINPNEWIGVRFVFTGAKGAAATLDDVAISKTEK